MTSACDVFALFLDDSIAGDWELLLSEVAFFRLRLGVVVAFAVAAGGCVVVDDGLSVGFVKEAMESLAEERVTLGDMRIGLALCK